MKISSKPVKEQTISKINVACRQLESAITLYFQESDPIAVHTLACAAHQIIHDINQHNKGPELLFNRVIIKDEFRGLAIKHLHKHYNFFKHANKDPDPNWEIEFDPKITEVLMVFAIKGLSYLKVPHSQKMTAFLVYFQFLNPKFSSLNKFIYDSIKIDMFENIRWVNRSDFLNIFLNVWGQRQ